MSILLFARSGSRASARVRALWNGFYANRSLWRFLSFHIPTSDPPAHFYWHKICLCLVSWPKSVPKPRFCSRPSWEMRSCSVRSSWSFFDPQHFFQCAENILNLRPAGGPKAPLWFFANSSWSTRNFALKLAIPLRATILHLVLKIRTQVIIGQPWVTSEWRHVSSILTNKMGLRESPPLV